MADIKIFNMVEATTITDTDLIVVEDSADTKKITKANFKETLGINDKAPQATTYTKTEVDASLLLKANKWLRVDSLVSPLQVTSVDFENPNVVTTSVGFTFGYTYVIEFYLFNMDGRRNSMIFLEGNNLTFASQILVGIVNADIHSVSIIPKNGHFGFYSVASTGALRALYVNAIYVVRSY